MQRIDKEIPDDLREELESKENVVGVGKGQKLTDDGKTGEEAIVVFVKEKVPEDELSEDDLVPSTVTIQADDEAEEQEVKTDVIESGELYAQAEIPPETTGETQPIGGRQSQQRMGGPVQSTEEVTSEGEVGVRAERTRRDRWRPAPAGVSIGHPEITAGTLGSPPLRTQDDETVFLTNAHVAAPPGVKRGNSVLQPGRADSGKNPEDQIGTVLEWGQLTDDDVNQTDSALVRIDDTLVKNEIHGLPPLKGWANARYDETHYKSGRTTGLTNGELLARDVTARVNYGQDFDGPLTFEGLDVFTAMSAGGDSGSLIGRQKEDGFYASDLLFAGSDRITLGIPMNTVQDEHGTLEPMEERTQQGVGRRGVGQQGTEMADQPPQQLSDQPPQQLSEQPPQQRPDQREMGEQAPPQIQSQATAEREMAMETEVTAQAATLYTSTVNKQINAGASEWISFDWHHGWTVFSATPRPYSVYGYFRILEERHYKVNATTVRSYYQVQNIGSSTGWCQLRLLWGA